MEPFYFLQELPESGESCLLTGDEARHLAAARRQATGDEVFLFNGQGVIARATIERIKQRGPEVQLCIQKKETQEVGSRHIILACAIPKGDRQRVLFDAVTQLGVHTIIPLLCQRSNIRTNEKQHARWQRICFEACKQSRRAHLPVVEPALCIADALSRMGNDRCNITLAHPGNAASAMAPASTEQTNAGLFIGPEGGFTEPEIQQIRDAGAKTVCMGRNILRTEIAAIALLSRLI
jgi:16S rRNA (uracil1498-N3)-methyltransferase